MEIVAAALLFVTLATAVFALGAATVTPRSLLGARLRSLLGFEAEEPSKPALDKRLERALEPLSKMVPKSPTDVSRTRALLMQAGYREPRHVSIYYGIRGACALVAVALAVSLGLTTRSPLIPVGLAGLGFTLPRFALKRRIKARQHKIRLALPDALDLAVICVEAGLGLDQSIKRVAGDLRHAHPDLSEELELVVLEMRVGRPRVEALRNLAARTGVDDVRALVAVLVQTDRFGTSVAQALRVHSDALRTERRQRAEEQAAKTTIKMVPVLVFFLFPAMFFVTLGPAFIQLYRNLLPVIQK
jgi:tight adherence protein C